MRRWLAGLLLSLAAIAPACRARAEPQPWPAAADAQRILVLVRLPAQHLRPSTAYSGGAGYSDDLARRAERRLAGRIARAHGLSLVDDWPMPLLGLECFVMAAPTPRTAEATAAELSRDPGVVWSEPMHVYHAEASAGGQDDPLFRAQPAAREWRLAELHTIATGRRVMVAVIDSQVDATHPDLAGQVATSANFAPQPTKRAERHGTGVAGVIAAKADNGIGVAGVAPGARLLALRACWEEGRGAVATVCDSLSLAKALHFAVEHRAQVINMSLAGPPDLLLGKLVDVALGRGLTVVAAYDPQLPRGGFPASHAGVVAVGDESVARLQPGVYTAPGRDVPTTEPGGQWALVDGSSYAAAQVSGLVALARERAAVLGRKLTLVSVRPPGGAIDACATLSHPCAVKVRGEAVVSLRR